MAALAADQVSKSIFRAHPAASWPWPGIFEFTSHQNYGLIANAPVPMLVIVPATLSIMVFLAYRIFFVKHTVSVPECLALALILGGASGNFLDRIRLGFVFDWIMFFNTSIINIADIAIGVGILWYSYLLWSKPEP